MTEMDEHRKTWGLVGRIVFILDFGIRDCIKMNDFQCGSVASGVYLISDFERWNHLHLLGLLPPFFGGWQGRICTLDGRAG